MDTLTFHVHSVMLPWPSTRTETVKGSTLSMMTQLMRSIVEVANELNWLAHSLLIAEARVSNVPIYKDYRMERKNMLPKVRDLLVVMSVDMNREGKYTNLRRFSNTCQGIAHSTVVYSTVVYSVLRCDRIMIDGQVASHLRINLLCDREHYRLITNLRGPWTRVACDPRVTWDARAVCGKVATRRAMAARKSCHASGTTLGSPAKVERHFRNARRALQEFQASGDKEVDFVRSEAQRRDAVAGAVL